MVAHGRVEAGEQPLLQVVELRARRARIEPLVHGAELVARDAALPVERLRRGRRDDGFGARGVGRGADVVAALLQVMDVRGGRGGALEVALTRLEPLEGTI